MKDEKYTACCYCGEEHKLLLSQYPLKFQCKNCGKQNYNFPNGTYTEETIKNMLEKLNGDPT